MDKSALLSIIPKQGFDMKMALERLSVAVRACARGHRLMNITLFIPVTTTVFRGHTKGCTTAPASVLAEHWIQFGAQRARSIEPRKAGGKKR